MTFEAYNKIWNNENGDLEELLDSIDCNTLEIFYSRIKQSNLIINTINYNSSFYPQNIRIMIINIIIFGIINTDFVAYFICL